MLHRLGCLVLEVQSKVDNETILLHVLVCDLSNPAWNCGGKEADLQVFGALFSYHEQNALYVFFEAKLKHLVSFIKNYSLNVCEVDVATLNVVEHTASSAHKDFDASFKLASLVVD